MPQVNKQFKEFNKLFGPLCQQTTKKGFILKSIIICCTFMPLYDDVRKTSILFLPSTGPLRLTVYYESTH